MRLNESQGSGMGNEFNKNEQSRIYPEKCMKRKDGVKNRGER